MKILYLITNNTLGDGIARHILEITGYFATNPFYQITPIVCTVLPEADFACALKQKGVKVVSLNVKNGHDIRIIPRFYHLLQEIKPDLIHSHVMALFERILLACIKQNIPIITTCHGIASSDLTKEHEKSLRKLTEDFFLDHFPIYVKRKIYISQGVRDFYQGDQDSVCIYNPISLFPISRKRYYLHKLLGLPSTTPLIGTVCRISQQKNPKTFVNIMCNVLKYVPAAHAVVCGSGPETLLSELNAIVAATPVANRFHWLGYRADAPELTRDLNCFIMTSITEGLPTALLEAMAARVPVAFMETNGGMIDLARLQRTEGPWGIMVSRDDERGMIKAIIELLKDQNLQNKLTEQAVLIIQKHFSIEQIASQLKHVYQEALTEGKE